MRSRGSDLLHQDGDADRPGLLDLYERVGDINVGVENRFAGGAGHVDGVRGGLFDPLDMAPRSTDGDRGRIAFFLDDLESAGKRIGAGDAGID